MIVGTAIKIIVTTEIQGDSASITVYNPDGTVKVTAAMTDILNQQYSYIFQSSSSDQIGLYCAVISIVNGSNTSTEQKKFQLDKVCL